MEQYLEERSRLKTFKDYPLSASKFAIVLAHFGFIYIGDDASERCSCVFCGCVKDFWERKEDVETVHRKLSPSCPMVTNRKCGNIPINLIRPWKSMDEIMEIIKYNTKHDEVMQWSNYYKDLCASIKKNILNKTREPILQQRLTHFLDILLTGISEKESSKGEISSLNDLINPSKPRDNFLSQLGIVGEKPTEMATYNQRLETFIGWSKRSLILPSTLARAGFYYKGYNDVVKCYHCGLGLRYWKAEDDVWVLHAARSSRCGFLRQLLGQPFIDAAVELKSWSKNKVSFEMVIEKLGKIASIYHLDTFNNSLKADPAVQVMVNSEYEENIILKEAQELQSQGKPIDVYNLLQKITNQEEELPATKERVLDLVHENQKIRTRTLCQKCLHKDVEIAFLPCMHLHYCLECSSAMSECLSCNTHISSTLRVFITS